MKTFKIKVAPQALTDLRRRLESARLPDHVAQASWDYGVDMKFLQRLIDHWRTRFDWRQEEKTLNRPPQFLARVKGQRIHFIYARGKGPSPKPLILTHGWPSSVAEFTKIIPRLTDPAAYGGDPRDAFDVVAPSMPGYGFSVAPRRPGVGYAAVASLWHELMTRTLGHRSFFAHGGDIGAGVTHRLGLHFPREVRAIHTLSAPRRNLGPNDRPPTAAEKKFIAINDQWSWEEGAYSHQQQTRPQTLAIGLNDSPAGLAAWIVEKFRAWSDCKGDVERRFTLDELLTNISLYWFTGTIGSSVRMYLENTRHDKRNWDKERIRIPARLLLTVEACDRCPREWAARSFDNLSYGKLARGGHFLAAEEPAALALDLQGFFRRFR
jgi:pimeloyl-ACP methyl ester carboxylesterase